MTLRERDYGYGEGPLPSGHTCCYAGCGDDAWHVMVEAQPLAMLFKSGAGLTCPKHARDARRFGAVDALPIGAKPEVAA